MNFAFQSYIVIPVWEDIYNYHRAEPEESSIMVLTGANSSCDSVLTSQPKAFTDIGTSVFIDSLELSSRDLDPTQAVDESACNSGGTAIQTIDQDDDVDLTITSYGQSGALTFLGP